MLGVQRAKSLRPQQLCTRMAEERLGVRVHSQDAAMAIHHHHGVGKRFQLDHRPKDNPSAHRWRRRHTVGEDGAARALDRGMPRSIWSGSIAFGLVNIPVKMYTAVQPKDVHFHQLHDADGVRIQQKRWCPQDEQEVPYEHIVKGYEISKGRYVVIQPDELRALDPHATGTIDIEQFVAQSEIDPLHYEHSYYLGPDRGASKAYALLLAAMERAEKVALGRVVLRTKQYLALLRPLQGVLAMETL